MKFYLPMKPHKWGFKIHLLCDSKSNYLYKAIFDPSAKNKEYIYSDTNAPLAENIVLN